MAPPKFPPGTKVAGQFEIIDEKGEGSFGVVYLANDSIRGERVALKFLKTAPRGEELNYLAREIGFGQLVSHPNVCQLHGTGSEAGRIFLNMEYVEGGDLEDLITKSGHPSRANGILKAIELCSGLEAIHALGIVHRDLKPANVMLDQKGHVKITDFGLAVPANLRIDNRGTPLYMAPEQWEGKPPHPSADIYSLGLMLFKLFTGRVCIDPRTNWLSLPDIHRAHALGRGRKPSAETTGLDPSIDHIVSKCLEENPARRPDARTLLSLLTTL